MNYSNTFEDLYIRKESKSLFIIFYKIFNNKIFKDYFFRDQLLRATLSISNNISEGYERQTSNELIRFLYIARGSSGEVRNMLIIAKDLEFISDEQFKQFLEKLNKISSGLKRLIDSINESKK